LGSNQSLAVKEDRGMAKFMVLWEVDTNRIPEDAKVRKARSLAAQESVMGKLKEGVLKEWGLFAGEMSGYIIVEGSAVDLQTLTSLWVPMVKFTTTKEVLTINEVNKALPE
jgi:hypothetical protein